MNLARLLQLLHPRTPCVLGPFDPAASVLGVTEDSRRVAPGWIFVARPGLRADGRRFIPAALRAGAVAVVTDHPPEQAPPGAPPGAPPEATPKAPILLTPDPALLGARIAEHLAGSPSAALALVGITGTNGKTTTATLIARAARAAGLSCGLIGTVEVDDGSHATPSAYTTPPAELLSPMLARMREQGCVAAAMEVSSHALDQHRTAGMRFAAGVYTNLTGDHLDYHGDMDRYAAAKARLFAQLEPDALAVVNAADPWHERVVGGCRARVLCCAPRGKRTPRGTPDAVVTFTDVSAGGMALRLDGPWGTLHTHTTLIGAHNAMNLLQAVAVCTGVLGITPSALAEIIPGLCAPIGRLEPVHGSADDIAVLIDFAHTDDALANCLRAARLATPAGARLWVVFGCGGNKDRTKRPRMGAAAVEGADRVVITSDNPRTEDPEAIIDEICAGIPAEKRSIVQREADRQAAIRMAVLGAAPGDVLVLAGKGHEREQELSDGCGGIRTIPFDEHRIAREALAARRAMGERTNETQGAAQATGRDEG